MNDTKGGQMTDEQIQALVEDAFQRGVATGRAWTRAERSGGSTATSGSGGKYDRDAMVAALVAAGKPLTNEEWFAVLPDPKPSLTSARERMFPDLVKAGRVNARRDGALKHYWVGEEPKAQDAPEEPEKPEETEEPHPEAEAPSRASESAEEPSEKKSTRSYRHAASKARKVGVEEEQN